MNDYYLDSFILTGDKGDKRTFACETLRPADAIDLGDEITSANLYPEDQIDLTDLI